MGGADRAVMAAAVEVEVVSTARTGKVATTRTVTKGAAVDPTKVAAAARAAAARAKAVAVGANIISRAANPSSRGPRSRDIRGGNPRRVGRR